MLLLSLLLGCAPRSPAPPPEVAAAPDPVVERVYRLEATRHVRAPERLEELMGQFFDAELLLQARYAPGREGTVELVVASVAEGDGLQQDRCAPTTTLAGIPISADGAFSIEGAGLGFVTEGVAVRYEGLRIEGGRLEEGALTAARIAGVVDTAPMGVLLGSEAPDAVCALVGKVLPCGACPAGEAETCWAVELAEVRAEAVAVGVVARSREEVCADPACAGAAACIP